MARSYGALKVAVWEPTSGFRNLTQLAQWAYVLLISQPQINNLGVLPFTPEKWVRFAFGMRHETLDEALTELDELRYIVVDRETGELLVRTFIKHDKVWQQPSLATNARKLIREVESDRIRGLLTSRHPWLLTSESRETIEAYELAVENEQQSQEKTPAGSPLKTPPDSPLGSRAPAGAGAGEGSGVGAAAEVSSTSNTTNSHYAETEQPGDPAAAVESPTESDIREACTRFGADLNVVEPIARQLPGAVFAATVTKHAAKVKRGSVDDVPAHFVHLLKAELKDQARAAAKHAPPMPPTRLPENERPVKATGEDWVRHIVPTLTRHPFERVAALIAERAEAEDWTPAELEQRQHLALELHQAEAA